ncbi:MAG: CDP-alcohol phosphatidyltransferase family protein [Myxococcales bacterium]|nr:CDP-alcohol phosphatidyltransferase family protein [Myxococcales bacterium]
MTTDSQRAVVICPEDADPDRRILGLSVGERLLLALSFAGVKEVCFVGAGPRPSCEKAELGYFEVEALEPEQAYLVLPSDAVFDRSLLSETSLPGSIPLKTLSGDSLIEQLGDLSSILTEFGTGHATSGRGFALRVDSRRSARQAEKALLLSLRKPIDGFVSTHLNRYVSLFCTRFLVKTGVSPNFFTIIFMAIGLTAAVFATQAEYVWALVLAGALFQAQSILDGCDGEMARLTYQFSRRGQWLDSIGDDLTNYSVCFGLAIGQARVLDEPILYWLGAGVLVVQLITSGVLYRRMFLMGTGDLLAIPDLVRSKEPTTGIMGFISDATYLVLKRDTFIFLLSLMMLLQHPLLAFSLYGIGTLPMALGVLLNDYRIARQDA